MELAGFRQYYCPKRWETRDLIRTCLIKTLLKCEGLKYHPPMLQVVLMTPSEVAKVRMQTQRNPHPSVASPQPLSKPKYRGSLHCLRVIAKEEGFGGLYKGCSALLCRDCASSAIYFLTYSALCDWLTPAGKNKPGRNQRASGITCKSGLFSATLRGTSGSQQTSPGTYKASPRSGPRTGSLCVCFLAPQGHLCPPGHSSPCRTGV